MDDLLDRDVEVVVFDRSRERFRPALPDVTYVRGELGNRGEVENIVSKGVDVVVHLISSTVPKTSNDDPIFDVQMNLVESLALFDLCVKHKVRKVVFISSGGTVYGNPKQLPIAEDHPTDPICSYGIVKLSIEKYLKFFHEMYGLDYVILRPSNPFGIRQDPSAIQGVVPVFMANVLQGMPVRLWGDGTIVRDFVAVRDVAELCGLAVTSEKCGTFNVGSGVGTSIAELLERISGVLGFPAKLIQEPGRTFDVPTVVLDNSRARKEFDWEPRTEMLDGLAELAQWMKQGGVGLHQSDKEFINETEALR